MALTKYVPTTRVNGEKIVLRNNQFARFLSRRTGLSQRALSRAVKLIGDGILQVLAEGYDFQWLGLGTFETRELKPRKRYHRMKGEVYVSRPSVIVHFHKSPSLNDSVRNLAIQRLDALLAEPTVKASTTGRR